MTTFKKLSTLKSRPEKEFLPLGMDIPNYKIIGWSAVILIVLLMTLYVYEFDYFGNTIHFENLFWKAMAFALLVGVFLGWRFQKKGKSRWIR